MNKEMELQKITFVAEKKSLRARAEDQKNKYERLKEQGRGDMGMRV